MSPGKGQNHKSNSPQPIFCWDSYNLGSASPGRDLSWLSTFPQPLPLLVTFCARFVHVPHRWSAFFASCLCHNTLWCCSGVCPQNLHWICILYAPPGVWVHITYSAADQMAPVTDLHTYVVTLPRIPMNPPVSSSSCTRLTCQCVLLQAQTVVYPIQFFLLYGMY